MKNTSFGVLPCLEDEARTYITYWWKRASMMEWHERWDDPANKKYLRWYLRRMTNPNIFPSFLRVFPESPKPCQTSSSANEPIFKQFPQPKGHETRFFFWIIQISPNKLGFPKWHFQGLQSPQVVVNGQRDCRLSSWGELTSLEDLRAVLTSKCQEAKEKLPLSLRMEIGRLTPSHHSEGCRWLIESCDIHKKV